MTRRIDCFVSVVAPVGNDAGIVGSFVAETIELLRRHYTNYEVVLVDDASRDGSSKAMAEVLRTYECVRVIRLSRAFGLDIAISAGLDSVIGDFVIVMLPCSDPVERIPDIVEGLRRGAGVVFGVHPPRHGQGPLMRAGGAMFSWYCRRVLGLEVPTNAAIFRGLSRQAVNALIQIRDRCRYLPILSAQIGYDAETFEYTPRPRGRTQPRSLAGAVSLAIDVMTTASKHPLRFVTWMGMFAGVCNGAYTAYVIAIYLLKPDVAEGWTTLSLQTASMFFFVFLILTVLSEYVGHILVQSEDRPLYHVVDERTSPVVLADASRRNVITRDAAAGVGR